MPNPLLECQCRVFVSESTLGRQLCDIVYVYPVMIACGVTVEPAQTIHYLSMHFELWPILNESPAHRRILFCPNSGRHPSSVHFHVHQVRERRKVEGSK